VPDASKMEWTQVYHEHLSYFTQDTLNRALVLRGFKVEKWESKPVHGGTIRAYCRLVTNDEDVWYIQVPSGVAEKPEPILRAEAAWDFLSHHRGQKVVGYGASAKANVFLNYAGIGPELIECIVDSTPEKQDKWLACGIPVVAKVPAKTDVVVLFSEVWENEMRAQLARDGFKGEVIRL
jgi:methylation protein EvaC